MLPAGGSLLFTGATMSKRAGANFSTMAPASFARRALAQSLAKEFGPRGIHVCHVIVDGLIATAHVENMMGKSEEGSRLLPDDIAKVSCGNVKLRRVRVRPRGRFVKEAICFRVCGRFYCIWQIAS